MAPVLGLLVALATVRAQASPYGVNAHVPPPELLDRIATAGISWVRIDFLWAWVEPEQDHFDWQIYDQLVAGARARNLEVFATISATPAWATDGAPGAGAPRQAADWYDICYRAAARYRGRIAAWGMWNEPNQSQFWQGGRQAYIDTILKTGAQAVHAADPRAKVCGPELAHLQSAHWNDWLQDVLRQASSSLDVVTHHLYPDGFSASSVRRDLLEDGRYPWEPPSVRKVLKDGGWLGRPFWLTETGANSFSPDPGGEASQAAFVQGVLGDLLGPSRAVTWVQRVFFYEISDDPTFPAVTYGLLGAPPEYRPKPAYQAYEDFIAGTAIDDSEIVQASFPRALRPAEAAVATITVRNTGSTTWTDAGGYWLAAVGNEDSFALGRVYLAAGDVVAPGASHTFAITLVAPTQETPPGQALVSDWQMVRDNVHWFGDVARGTMAVTQTPDPQVFYLPAVLSTTGLGGVRWNSDATVHNPGAVEAAFTITALEQGIDNARARRTAVTLAPGRSVRSTDVLASVFGFAGTTALRLEVERGALLALGRTYTQRPDGTIGELTPALPAASAVPFGGGARLIQLARDPTLASGFRTNLGLINTTAASITVEADLYGDGAALLGTLAYSLPPWGFRQVTDVYRALTAKRVKDGFIVVRTTTPAGAFLAYALVIDNRSSDLTVMLPVAATDRSLIVPLAAHNTGIGGSTWRTDLGLHNPGTEAVTVALRLLPGAPEAARDAAVVVPGGASTRLEDVVGTAFAFEGSGALRLSASGGALAVTSRTYDVAAAGTFGESVPASAEADAPGLGEEVRLLGLSRAADLTRGLRTNVGLLNLATVPITLQVSVFRATGTLVGRLDYTLAAGEWRQLTDFLKPFAWLDGEECYATARTTTPEGRFLAFASVIDNRLGDPAYVPGLE